MKKRQVVGLTGGIASGKSTVLTMLAKRGIPTISSDTLAHQCIQRGTPAYRKILQRYGKPILKSDGQIDRGAVARIVFEEARERRWLERLVHPCVIQRLKRFAATHGGLVVLDIPLLFEARLEKLVDVIAVVYCRPDQQVKRLRRATGWSMDHILKRMASQKPLSWKKRRADWVIRNVGTRAHLRGEVQKLLDGLPLGSGKSS